MCSSNLLHPDRHLSNFPQGSPQMKTVWLARQFAPATVLCISAFNLVPWLALNKCQVVCTLQPAPPSFRGPFQLLTVPFLGMSENKGKVDRTWHEL